MRRKAWMALCLTAAMILQPVGLPEISANAASGMLTESDLSDANVKEPEAWGAVPNEAQRYYQTQGLAAFCHFGPNTFNNVEWGENYGTRAPGDIFTLREDFDADNMVKMLKDAGFSRLMLTAKHHDGFCIWASELTDYDISNTSYKNGQGDILEELSDACTKYNMDMGLYLSPWDIHEDKYGCYGNSKEGDYNELYTNWIREICTAKKANGEFKYGNNNPNRRTDRFIEWWMDGATGSGSSYQTYDWQGIFDAIRETNPTCQIFGTHMAGTTAAGVKLGSTGGVHWIGNEDGLAADETWAKVEAGGNYESIRANSVIKGFPNGDTWSVPECDTKMLSSGWFWSASKQGSLRSMKNLAEIYYHSVGHGATLLLNVSPNTSGKLDENQNNRMIEFGEAVKESFANDLTKTGGASASASSVWGNAKAYSPMNVLDTIPEGELYDETYWSAAEGETTGTLELRFEEAKTFNTISIEEYIPKGQKISSFSVEYQENGVWKEYGAGATIGSKRLCRGAEVTADAIRINILSALGTPMISNVGLYKTTDAFALTTEKQIELPTNLQWLDMQAFSTTGTWGTDNYDDGTIGKWSNADRKGEAQFTFTGTKAWISGTIDPNHGTADIYIDGKKVDSVDTNSDTRKTQVVFYETPELEYGEHTVKFVITSAALGLYGAYYQDGSGIFEVDQARYDAVEDETVDVKIVRKGGSKGQASVTYSTPSGGAEQGVNYEYQNETVVFADGETEKTITIKINHSPKVADGLNFYFVLDNVEGASLGNSRSANIVIKDIDKDLIEKDKKALLETAEQMKPAYESGKEAYTQESWAAFEKAYLAVQQINENADTAELSRLKAALEEAYKALTKVGKDVQVLAAPDVTGVKSTVKGVIVTFKASANADSYEVYRKVGGGQPVQIGTAATVSFVDQKPAGGKNMTYLVKAVSKNTELYQSSGFGAEKSIKLPKAPKKVTAKAAAKSVKITIKPVKGVKKYVILRSTAKDGNYKKIKKVSGKKKVTFTDKKVKKGKKYFYKVIAVKGKLYSPAKTSKGVKIKK